MQQKEQGFLMVEPLRNIADIEKIQENASSVAVYLCMHNGEKCISLQTINLTYDFMQ